jgi:hypothetical protein
MAGRRRVELRVELRAQPGQAARTAVLALRFGVVTIKRPKCRLDRQAPERLSLDLVEVRKVDATVAKPIHWQLLTTHAVETPEAAWRIVAWFSYRFSTTFRTKFAPSFGTSALDIAIR